jgi:hypothetical protein
MPGNENHFGFGVISKLEKPMKYCDINKNNEVLNLFCCRYRQLGTPPGP